MYITQETTTKDVFILKSTKNPNPLANLHSADVLQKGRSIGDEISKIYQI